MKTLYNIFLFCFNWHFEKETFEETNPSEWLKVVHTGPPLTGMRKKFVLVLLGILFERKLKTILHLGETGSIRRKRLIFESHTAHFCRIWAWGWKCTDNALIKFAAVVVLTYVSVYLGLWFSFYCWKQRYISSDTNCMVLISCPFFEYIVALLWTLHAYKSLWRRQMLPKPCSKLLLLPSSSSFVGLGCLLFR